MKNYQPTKSQYTLPKSIYYRVIYFVRDYPRLLEEIDAILEATPPPSETPEVQKQRNIRATETVNLKYSEIKKDIRDIEETLIQAVPPEARKAIMSSIIYGESYPLDLDRRTYSRYKQKFIYRLAERRNLI